MVNGITKKEIHDELTALRNSAKIIGSESLVGDIDSIIERIKKEL